MSPTVFREGSNRYYFFSREEARMHIHVLTPNGEAKFWIEPEIELVNHSGLSDYEIKKISDTIKERKEEICAKWNSHFGG